MASVYLVKDDGRSEPMSPILCKNEDKELQTLLENNFDLLPGDQIDPDLPCRWMLIKREMPVPDPYTGTDRWNIDFLFVDQNATPTFVECKRYLDTRSRREVVGQVLEYAANAQHFWSAEDIRTHAETTAKANGTTIEQSLGGLQSDVGDGPDAFFKEVERHLKTGDVRIVFFLEQAPAELKRLVEFLNKQMGSVEVLLVEARQFTTNGTRGTKIIVPTLFGFTEQIREIKRKLSSERDRQAVAIDWDSFRANAQQKGLSEDDIARMRKLYDACGRLQADLAWGRGSVTGSFSPKWRSLGVAAAPFSVFSDGKLDLHFIQFHTSQIATDFVTTLAESTTQGGLSLPKDYMIRWCTCYPNDWLPKVEVFIAALEKATSRIAVAASRPE
jgi:hypothetical protein